MFAVLTNSGLQHALTLVDHMTQQKYDDWLRDKSEPAYALRVVP